MPTGEVSALPLESTQARGPTHVTLAALLEFPVDFRLDGELDVAEINLAGLARVLVVR